MAVVRADLVGSTSTFTLCIPLEDIWETREMICYVLAMGKQHLGPHVVVGYGIKNFWPGLFITSPDHLAIYIAIHRRKKDVAVHLTTMPCNPSTAKLDRK